MRRFHSFYDPAADEFSAQGGPGDGSGGSSVSVPLVLLPCAVGLYGQLVVSLLAVQKYAAYPDFTALLPFRIVRFSAGAVYQS